MTSNGNTIADEPPARRCGRCGASNLPEASFCAVCDAFLPAYDVPSGVAPPIEPSPPATESGLLEPRLDETPISGSATPGAGDLDAETDVEVVAISAAESDDDVPDDDPAELPTLHDLGADSPPAAPIAVLPEPASLAPPAVATIDRSTPGVVPPRPMARAPVAPASPSPPSAAPSRTAAPRPAPSIGSTLSRPPGWLARTSPEALLLAGATLLLVAGVLIGLAGSDDRFGLVGSGGLAVGVLGIYAFAVGLIQALLRRGGRHF